MPICLGHVADNPPDACFDLVLTAQPVRADDFTSQSKMCDSNVLRKCKQKYASPTPNKSLTRRDNAVAWRETEARPQGIQICRMVETILQCFSRSPSVCSWVTFYYSVSHLSMSFMHVLMRTLSIQFVQYVLGTYCDPRRCRDT